MDSRFLKIIILMCLIFLGVLYYELDHIGEEIKPANFEIDYTITKAKSGDATIVNSDTTKAYPKNELKPLAINENHPIHEIEKQMAEQLVSQNQNPHSLDGKVYCSADVNLCNLCYDESIHDYDYKNCSYVRKKMELDFISENYDMSINQKVEQNISAAFSGDLTEALKSINNLTYNYSKTIDEFKPSVSDIAQYQNDLNQYYLNHPIMCFAFKNNCLDKSQVDENFPSDPRVIKYFNESN